MHNPNAPVWFNDNAPGGGAKARRHNEVRFSLYGIGHDIAPIPGILIRNTRIAD